MQDWVDSHQNPPGLIEMLGIPGLGPKRIKLMADELGVDSVAALMRLPPTIKSPR